MGGQYIQDLEHVLADFLVDFDDCWAIQIIENELDLARSCKRKANLPQQRRHVSLLLGVFGLHGDISLFEGENQNSEIFEFLGIDRMSIFSCNNLSG